MERFTTFDGRIGRQSWWIGIGILFLVTLGLIIILGLTFGDSFFGRLLQFIFSAIIFAGYAGLSVRRLHDRNKAANPWLIIFIAPGLLYNLMSMLGIGFYRVEMMGESFWVPGTLGWLVGLVSMAVGIWALVELGVLQGTQGDNDFGPDPLQ